MPRNLSFHRCLRVSLRGTNKVGLVSVVSADIRNCSAKDPLYIVPRIVLDASGGTSGASLSEGKPVSIAFSDEWSQEDQEYTTHTNIISAVWPTLRHSRVRWAVLESQGPDVSSHFINEDEQNMMDPCSSLYAVACGEVSGQKYINVFFGPPHERSLLEDGHHYYVCIHAEAETVVYEKWSEVLQEVSACSDGITVDQTPPQEGVVYIDGLLGGIYQSSLKTLSVRWDGFSDVQELGLTSHHSGILRYYIAVGSTPGGWDVLKFQDVGQVNHVMLHTLSMQSGLTYYVTVRAEDNVGLTMDGISSGFVIDNTAPERTDKQMQFPDTFITSHNSFSVCWEDLFEDNESGVVSFIVSLGSRPGHDDIMEGQIHTTTCADFFPDRPLVEGHAYYVTIKAMNGAGLFTSAVSRPWVVMTSAPAAGHVYDGPPPTDGGVAFDVDFTRSPSDVAAFWRGFSTSLSPVATYYVRLGTCSGCDDIVGEFDIGLSQDLTWDHISLSEGVRYYTTVRACNVIDWCTEMASDGILIDITPPVAGDVWDGAGDADICFQSQRDFLAAKWTGFVDVSSGLVGFTWRSGTSPGAADIMASRSVGLALEAFTSDLSTPLPENRTIYITITAMDRAGNWIEVTSNGFKVDTTAPVVKQVPQLNGGLGTLGGPRLVSRDTLSARWSLEDTGSPVAAHFVSITSHLLGEFESSPLQVPAPVSVYTFTSLSLHDGSLYRVKVTTCNAARLCTTSVSEEILHDSTPPVTGMFAVKTDHAANLTRHLDGWMVWSSQQLRLAWLGFLDVHSGLDHYIISVGSFPFANDLNLENTSIKVLHNESETEYENEGFVQVYEVSTKPLSAGLKIFISIWAVNRVGLQSHPALSEFELEEGGGMSLVRRCTPFNCLSHCSCAVQGATCGASSSCTPIPEGSNPNSLLTVHDHTDLTTLLSPRTSSSPSLSDEYIPSSSYLAASWNVTVHQGLKPNRYEVSAGRSDQATPAGVFHVAHDRLWMDVGVASHSLLTIPSGSLLIPKLKYSTFVRAWYPDGNFALFKSKGVIPLPSRPSIINFLGRGVKEHTQAGQDKDVDYVTKI
ncbi:uncharacterized protein LOC112558908 [Pomacea canaliculata]|uniref:uncharacterized protein LOC112558908 n=1 Tax=Pomacea canaliculata TaxID=400727 RepID=UPI000D7318B7|nr:uncharacterized protein LOC112558908 [Pomacea canaliculata]